MIAVQGWGFVAGGLAAGVAGLYLVRRRAAIGWAPLVLGFVFAAFCLYFFRDPTRPLPTDTSRIFSPADGRVLSVEHESPGGRTIRIFLSIFDVHIQRYPVSGAVEKVEYRKGSFAPAMDKEARANERNILTVRARGRPDKIVVEQIAGLVARRIRCWAAEGERAVAGRRYGLIQFGSQAAVHLPESARALVRPGDRVKGGVTPIAEWIDRDESAQGG
ncbi:MAG: phosphatidylserine decarboxylase, partial [Elusimicrobiota bacterium]